MFLFLFVPLRRAPLRDFLLSNRRMSTLPLSHLVFSSVSLILMIIAKFPRRAKQYAKTCSYFTPPLKSLGVLLYLLSTCFETICTTHCTYTQNKRLRVVVDEETQTDRPRSDARYSLWDAFMEALVSGNGPFGPVGFFGLWYRILVRYLTQRYTATIFRCFRRLLTSCFQAVLYVGYVHPRLSRTSDTSTLWASLVCLRDATMRRCVEDCVSLSCLTSHVQHAFSPTDACVTSLVSRYEHLSETVPLLQLISIQDAVDSHGPVPVLNHCKT